MGLLDYFGRHRRILALLAATVLYEPAPHINRITPNEEMNMPATEKPPRNRKGYVMVELSPEDRATLDDLEGRLSARIGTTVGRAGTLRLAIRAYRKNPEKFLRTLLTPS